MKKKIVLGLCILCLIGIIVFVYLKFFIKDDIQENKEENIEEVLDGTIINLDEEVTFSGEGVALSDGIVTINGTGKFYLNGNYNGEILIDSTDEVSIILEGVNITNSNGPALLVERASNVNVTLKEGTDNYLADGGDSEYDATIYSNSAISFDGQGSLIISGNQEEGIASENNSITINSGNIHVTSLDDGINAGGDNGGLIQINGGNVLVEAEGDGIDSNNNIEINGGTIIVYGSNMGDNGAMDADGLFTINGGTLVAIGNGMNQEPDSSSKQYSLLVDYNNKYQANTIINIQNNGNNVLTFKSIKAYQTLLYSSPILTNTNYQLYTGGEATGDNVNGLYSNAEYSGGTVLTNNGNDFILSSTVNTFKNI